MAVHLHPVSYIRTSAAAVEHYVPLFTHPVLEWALPVRLSEREVTTVNVGAAAHAHPRTTHLC
jgi:hypothetical protein